MYRDDVCPACGASLPPDHLYCRAHAAEVDDRLHEIAALLAEVRDAATRLAQLHERIAVETWDYLAEQEPDDPLWPPAPRLELRADADRIQVDVDSEPGVVQVRVETDLVDLLRALSVALSATETQDFAKACAAAQGAGATH
ncbi:MAG TPA: hypothetical protein VML96_09850 [Egibacteraceae bacterium]|nr:hypothetical protein [Egibacteraceae bacterium]